MKGLILSSFDLYAFSLSNYLYIKSMKQLIGTIVPIKIFNLYSIFLNIDVNIS